LRRWAHHPIRKHRGDQLDIIGWRDAERGSGFADNEVFERVGEFGSVGTGERVLVLAVP
jgi:hypothetical protein